MFACLVPESRCVCFFLSPFVGATVCAGAVLFRGRAVFVCFLGDRRIGGGPHVCLRGARVQVCFVRCVWVWVWVEGEVWVWVCVGVWV